MIKMLGIIKILLISEPDNGCDKPEHNDLINLVRPAFGGGRMYLSDSQVFTFILECNPSLYKQTNVHRSQTSGRVPEKKLNCKIKLDYQQVGASKRVMFEPSFVGLESLGRTANWRHIQPGQKM